MKGLLAVFTSVLIFSASAATREGRSALRQEELATMLQHPPSKAPIVTVVFGVTGNRGQKLKGPQTTDPAASSDRHGLPQIALRPGQSAKAERIREFIYPMRFDLPKLRSATGELTPAAPTQFKTQNVGWTIDNLIVIPKGAFYMVHGRFSETTFDGFIENPGDGLRPITSKTGRIFTDNRSRSPTFTTRETPFVVSAWPGRTYRLPLNLKQRGAVLELKCWGVDRRGRRMDRTPQ